MDEIDRRIVEALRVQGRQTYAELARVVGLSAPAVHDRVAKLEARGVITGYHATVDSTALGFGVTALIGILQSQRDEQDDVLGALNTLPEVEACWFVAGEESFVILVRVADISELEHTIGRLNHIPGITRTRTTVVLSTKWEGRVRSLLSE